MKFFQGIAKKFIFRIFLLSIGITVFYAGFNIYFDYSKAINETNQIFDNIESTHIKAIAESVWVANTNILNIQLRGIAGYTHVQHLELKTKDLPPISIGIAKEKYVKSKTYPLEYTYRSKTVELGSLMVCIDLEYLFREMFVNSSLIIISEAVKIFLLSAFIFYFFYTLVGRYLIFMADYTKVFDVRDPTPLILPRTDEKKGVEDELDQLANSINLMRQNIIDDIEKRVHVEKQLQESERHYRELVENTGDLITKVDAQGRFVAVNRKAEKVFGYSVDQLIGMPSFQFIHPDDEEMTQKWFESCLKEKKDQDSIENRQVNSKTKELFHMLWTSNFEYDEKGQLTSVSGVAHDITQRIQNEETVIQLKKLEAIGVMAGGIAHDFNNILAIISGYVDLAKEEVNQKEPICNMLNIIGDASLRAVDLTKKFLTFSSGGHPVKNICSLGTTIQNVAKKLFSGANIQYEVSITNELRMVNCDHNQIEQALINVMCNSKESMPAGGAVQIHAENMSAEDVAIKTGQECKHDQYILVSIADQGCGISSSNLPKIFDPYFSTKDKGEQKGMGLGLSITSSIIYKHHGFILVDSIPDSGTTVSIYIPAVESHKVELPVDESKVLPVVGKEFGTYKVLVMDDEKMLLEMFKSQLLSKGYEVETAENAEEAITLFSNAHKTQTPFHIAILDLNIKGGMGGKDTLKELQLIDPGVKAVACSGYSEDPVIAKFKEYGFRGALAKPFSKANLDDLLSKILSD